MKTLFVLHILNARNGEFYPRYGDAVDNTFEWAMKHFNLSAEDQLTLMEGEFVETEFLSTSSIKHLFPPRTILKLTTKEFDG